MNRIDSPWHYSIHELNSCTHNLFNPFKPIQDTPCTPYEVCWWCGRLGRRAQAADSDPGISRPAGARAVHQPSRDAGGRCTPGPGRSRRAVQEFPRTALTRRPRDAESGQILALLHRVPTFFGDYPRRDVSSFATTNLRRSCFGGNLGEGQQ